MSHKRELLSLKVSFVTVVPNGMMDQLVVYEFAKPLAHIIHQVVIGIEITVLPTTTRLALIIDL